ncbi:MAG: AAA+ family ATPase [Gemmobacter sp.]|nr:AAA+ family ATPase [Gemmobacter sp.]
MRKRPHTLASLTFALCLAAAPLAAQEAAPADPAPEDEGLSLMQRGAELLLRGLMDEVEPGLRDMEQALRLMEPELRALVDMVGDLRNYEAPEKLPNGDILIRRKPDAPPLPQDPPAPEATPPDPGGTEL